MKVFAVYLAEDHSAGSLLYDAWTAKGARRKWRRRASRESIMEVQLEVFEVVLGLHPDGHRTVEEIPA